MRHSRTHWSRDLRYRLRFERGVSAVFPSLKIEETGRTERHEVIYRLTVPIEGYEPRRLTVRVKNAYWPSPQVFADGPTTSPHRYRDESLCMWYWRDPPESKWLPTHGLLALVRVAQLHLLREAWWREKGEWLGPEAPHGPIEKAGAA